MANTKLRSSFAYFLSYTTLIFFHLTGFFLLVYYDLQFWISIHFIFVSVSRAFFDTFYFIFLTFLFDCLFSKNKGKEGEELGRWGRSRGWRSIKILSIKKNSQMKFPNDFVVVSQISRLPLKKTYFLRLNIFFKIHGFLAMQPNKAYFGSELQSPGPPVSVTVPPCALHIDPWGPKCSPGPSCPLLPQLQFPRSGILSDNL